MRFPLLFSWIVLAAGVAQAANPTTSTIQQPEAQMMQPPPALEKTPGDFLKKEPYPTAQIPGFYHEIPPSLEQAVRYAAEDNFVSSTQILQTELAKATDPKEKARILMWLGVTQGHEALDYQSAAGWYGVATSATKHLREAMKLDPEVIKAPDVARVLGQMVGSGWAQETPESEIDKAEKAAKEKKSGIDFYYAGVILQRIAQRSWEFSDTREEDERTLGYYAKAIVIDPDRYENWPVYCDAIMRLQMYDLLTSDTDKMFARFRTLRAPLFGDQGPANLYLKSRGPIPREMAESFLNQLKKDRPDDPYPHFTLAQVEMGAEEQAGTTPTKSIQKFEEFLASIKDGKITLLPREQGYRISAMYKLAYLYKLAGQPAKALEVYQQIKQLSPKYAETDYNMADTYLQLAEMETTGPKKLELLEKGRAHARDQAENDYKNRASLKSDELRRRISSLQRKVRAEMKDAEGSQPAAGAAERPKTVGKAD